MSDVGDAIELTYTSTPGATVKVSWIHLGGSVEDTTWNMPVTETLDAGQPTGRYKVTLTGSAAGMYEARFTATGTATATDSYYERFDPVGGLPPLTTLREYTDLYGSLSPARAATARALIKRASQLVRDTYPGIDARIAGDIVSADSAGLAVLNMVARVLRNPAGLRSETTGPFSRAYDMDAASGMLELTEAETGMLVPPGASAGAGARRRMGTARITGGMVPRPLPTYTDGRGLLFGPGGH